MRIRNPAFTQKLSLSYRYQNYGFGIRDLEKTYSGSRVEKSPDPGYGSATLEFTVIKPSVADPDSVEGQESRFWFLILIIG
jgi:hypothetical protein